jgi:hypothetical protein
MPPLTRWYLRTALIYFVAGLAAGAVLALRGWVALPPAAAALTPVYFHLLMVGWVTQLIFGVVFWMFPKESSERPRGSERLGWATYGLLNAGLLLRAAGEPWLAVSGSALPRTLVAASAALQLAAGWAFVANTWRRVR